MIEPQVSPAPASAPSDAASPASGDAASSAASAPLHLQEVAPGVFAALQPARRRFADCNAAVLVSEAGAVVIDAPQQVTTARWLHERVEDMTEGAQRGLVTTHWHLDHALGVTMLRGWLEAEGAAPQHWGHAGLAALLPAEGTEQLDEHRAALPSWIERGEAMQASGAKPDGTSITADERAQLDRELVQLRAQRDAVESLRLAAPTHPVTERTRVELGTLAFELIPVRAHTDADLVVLVPEAKVLITGDVLDELPFGGHGHPQQWLEVLRQLAALEVETIVPGHGPTMRHEAFDRAIALWSAILEQAAIAIRDGQSADERYARWSHSEGFDVLRAAMTRDAMSEQAFDAFVPKSLERAMAESPGP